jgi:HSP20 family molecular chaperone IbpA
MSNGTFIQCALWGTTAGAGISEALHPSRPRYGSFQRSFTVSDGVDAEKIDATFKDSVLTVNLPKTAEAQKKEKQIAIRKG